MLAGALHDVSRAWDVWYYHLPFAARIAGILGPEDLVFHRADQARFDGFPLLGEALQGALWRITGRPESANLVAWSAVPLFAWFLARAFRVPWQLPVLGLLAIPLVQIHATSAYVDLPANAATSVVVMLAIRAHAERKALGRRTLLLAVGAGALAANMKVMMGPLVLLGLGALVFPELASTWRAGLRDKLMRVALGVVSLCLVFATPLKNAVRHENPWYPVKVSVLGMTFAGPEEPYSFTPAWLSRAPKTARFFASLLEIGLRPYTSSRRWTIDQYMPPEEDGSRLGGFFGIYVVAMLLLLVVFAWREKSRRARVSAIGFTAFTLVVSVMPQAHELRYYMCWMLVLVALVLWLATSSHGARPGRGMLVGAVSGAALAVVIWVTGAGCIYPSGVSFKTLLQEQVQEADLARIPHGGKVCVDRAPWNVLFVARFHPPRQYGVYESEEPADCTGIPGIIHLEN
jgi:hypothetical protein